MTDDDLADLLRPIGFRLLEEEDDDLAPDVILAKAAILFVLGWLEDTTPAERRDRLPACVVVMAELFEAAGTLDGLGRKP